MTQTTTTILAFSADQVTRLTGLSKSQLRYWDNTEFFQPRFASDNRRSPFGRIYSFQDVVGLRVLGILRNRHKVPLQHLRKVARELQSHMRNPWSDTVLYVLGKEVYFKEPTTQRVRGAVSGQYVADIPLDRIAQDVVAESAKLAQRHASKIGQVERRRYVQHNASVISGTRIPTGTIWRFREAGYSIEQIGKEFPILTKRDIQGAIKFERVRLNSA